MMAVEKRINVGMLKRWHAEDPAWKAMVAWIVKRGMNLIRSQRSSGHAIKISI